MFAGSLSKKIVFGSRKVKLSKIATTLTPVRTLLSALYVSTKDAETFTKSTVQTEELALQTLSLDRCHERDMPVSSLMLDRLIRGIYNREQLEGSLYYLYKFRHSQNNYYIQPWTTFAFVSKCLQLDSRLLLEALANKGQYGIFPSSFLMNYVLDYFLNDNDLDGAIKCVGQMFLLETLDNRISQILSLHTICKFWKQKSQDEQLIPEFEDLKMKRDTSAALFCIGHYLSDPSLVIIGNSLLGSIELEHGIRAVYQEPWGPLSWRPGYLERAIERLETSTKSLSQQCVDILLQCASKDEVLLSKAQNSVSLAKSRNLVSDDRNLTLDGVAEAIEQNTTKYEEEERKEISNQFKRWTSDCLLLEELESEILNEFKVAREKHFREIAIEEKAHQMAVETLGYWDFEKGRKGSETETSQPEEKPIYYLREDYVDGAMEDLELLERFREKRSIVTDSVILMS